MSDKTQLQSKQAVALRYRPEEGSAPKVTAKGRGSIAEKILDLARKHNVPFQEDKDLLQVLSRLDLNQEIPREVYQAVAEILAFVYRMSRQRHNQSIPERRPGGASLHQ